MKRLFKTALVLLLAVSMFAGFGITGDAATRFPDVPGDAWYKHFLDMMTTYTPGIITGYEENGVYTFKPDNYLTRGEFLRMVSVATQLLPSSTTPPSTHWAADEWQMCHDNGILLLDYNAQMGSGQAELFGGSWNELEQYITRYEMAVIISNATTSDAVREARVTVKNASDYIPDYTSIPDKYKDAVEQAYGKGILNGYVDTPGIEDGSFCGDGYLQRSAATSVIYLLLWTGDRKTADFAQEGNKVEVVVPADFVSFAMKYRTMSDAERRTALFGDPNKTYFTSAQDAAGYMVDVVVPAWRINGYGEKYSSEIRLTVHKLVAKEVELIFKEIYNDPEQFPIATYGGARFTDALRHSWGCAIDLNYDQNYYCRIVNGVATALTGSGWWPGTNQYSITPNGSVVRAFAKYGWGWGGQGWSGGYHDYMHFSILASGG